MVWCLGFWGDSLGNLYIWSKSLFYTPRSRCSYWSIKRPYSGCTKKLFGKYQKSYESLLAIWNHKTLQFPRNLWNPSDSGADWWERWILWNETYPASSQKRGLSHSPQNRPVVKKIYSSRYSWKVMKCQCFHSRSKLKKRNVKMFHIWRILTGQPFLFFDWLKICSLLISIFAI